MSFEEIVDILLDSEFYHPKLPEETTKIILKACNPFTVHHGKMVELELCQFGRPENIYLFKERTDDGIVGEVDYPTQFQAYAAKIAMNGSFYECLGYVSVEVVVTESGRMFDL